MTDWREIPAERALALALTWADDQEACGSRWFVPAVPVLLARARRYSWGSTDDKITRALLIIREERSVRRPRRHWCW